MKSAISKSVVKAHDIRQFQFRDTPFVKLMNKRIYNILMIASRYDMFILQDDGRVEEQIFNEYASLNLRYPPLFTQVSTGKEAMNELKTNRYELVICMPNTVSYTHLDVYKRQAVVVNTYIYRPAAPGNRWIAEP